MTKAQMICMHPILPFWNAGGNNIELHSGMESILEKILSIFIVRVGLDGDGNAYGCFHSVEAVAYKSDITTACLYITFTWRQIYSKTGSRSTRSERMRFTRD